MSWINHNCMWLISRLQDESFDISTPISPNGNKYELINILRDATHEEYVSPYVWKCAYMYLQRLRREHIVIFSAVRQDFDQDLIKDVVSGITLDDFTVMIPKYCGRYDNWRHQKYTS